MIENTNFEPQLSEIVLSSPPPPPPFPIPFFSLTDLYYKKLYSMIIFWILSIKNCGNLFFLLL